MDDIGDDTVNEYIVKIIHAKVELANLKKRKNLILQEVHRQFLESEADPKKRIKSIKDIKIKNAKILNKVDDDKNLILNNSNMDQQQEEHENNEDIGDDEEEVEVDEQEEDDGDNDDADEEEDK